MGTFLSRNLKNPKMMCGGTTELKQPDDEARQVLSVIQSALLEKTGHSGKVDLIGYKTQVVAGTNYFMKIKIGENYAHARVFVPLPHTGAPAELHSVDGNAHTADSELAYF